MKITICVVGSRGDVQPAVALAMGLNRAGHEARVFTHGMFESLVRANGVEFVPLIGDPRDGLVRTAAAEMGHNPVRLVRWLRDGFRPAVRDLFRLTLDAVEGSDLVVASSLSLAAFHVAEKLGIPAISMQLQPTTITRAFPGGMVAPPPDWLPFKGTWNLLATKIGNQMAVQTLRPLTDACRRDILGLRPLGVRVWWNVDRPGHDALTLYAWSPAVLPKPADWGPCQQVTGYWFLDGAPGYVPPPELASFLDGGPPPVYVGLGSIIDHERDAMTRIAIDAMRIAGLRTVLHSGWSGLGSGAMPDSVHVLHDDVPHDWLLPRCAAMVHHGGAGTTAAGFRAALPAVVVPFYFDQFLWAWRVRELGAGPRWIPRKRLTTRRLAEALDRAVGDASMRDAAEAIAARIRAEDGVGTAVSLVETPGTEPAG